MRFGIGMNTGHTLEEAGRQFPVTRERIRQIAAKALRKLKHPSRSRAMGNPRVRRHEQSRRGAEFHRSAWQPARPAISLWQR